MNRTNIISAVREIEPILSSNLSFIRPTAAKLYNAELHRNTEHAHSPSNGSLNDNSEHCKTTSSVKNHFSYSEPKFKNWNEVAELVGLGEWFRKPFSCNSEGWILDSKVKNYAMSKLLTYPMTIAKFCGEEAKSINDSCHKSIRVAILGARAESTLPRLYWEQLGLVTNLKWHLTFIGPHVSNADDSASYDPETDFMVGFFVKE